MRTFASCSRRICLVFAAAALVAATWGCTSLGPFADRYEAADRIAAAGGLTKMFIETKGFTLTVYKRFSGPGEHLTVYIEGDGSAWLSRTLLSDDPTPSMPLALELAALDPAPNVAYLARPGQYGAGRSPGCDPLYWSDRRFSSEVVTAMNEAMDRLRADSRSGQVDLVGYSGGAAIAVLAASLRSDITSLRTVAGNLDSDAVNRHHGVSPLKGSVNPIREAAKLRDLPQRHFAGAADTVVPPFIAESFLKEAGDADLRRLIVFDGVTHSRGWRERWKTLLAVPPIPAR
jgi:hypothetical protein